MCFHSKQSKDAQTLEHRFQAKIIDPEKFGPQAHYNGFSYPETPVITHKDSNIIRHLHWGLIPFWAKDNNIRQYTLNARIETITQKPSFRDAAKNRCLVIADGFYEWKWLVPKGKKKQKFLIGLPEDALFCFAGIWSEWLDKETGELIPTYSIVTTEANALMSEIHHKNRMPVILQPGEEEKWLQGAGFENFIQPSVELVAEESQ